MLKADKKEAITPYPNQFFMLVETAVTKAGR
jgi:hypothetical protein